VLSPAVNDNRPTGAARVLRAAAFAAIGVALALIAHLLVR
jgi:hypothetical protein